MRLRQISVSASFVLYRFHSFSIHPCIRRRGIDNSREDKLPLLMSFITDSEATSPDQPMIENETGFRRKKLLPSNRRLTLPSIIKSFDNHGQPLDTSKSSEYDSGISLDLPQSRKYQEKCDVLIVDGQRKFMEVQSCANVALGETSYPDEDKPLDLPKAVKLKKVSSLFVTVNIKENFNFYIFSSNEGN